MLRAITLLLLVSSCTQSPQNQEDHQTSYQEHAPNHYYSVNSDGEYGYEKAVSQDDINAGQGASPLILFKYLGQKDGIHQLMHTESEDVHVVFECENPCKFIRAYILSGAQLVKKEMIAAADGTIGSLAMADAINGQLKQHIFSPGGIEHTLWYSDSRLKPTFTKSSGATVEERQMLGEDMAVDAEPSPEDVTASDISSL